MRKIRFDCIQTAGKTIKIAYARKHTYKMKHS